MITSSNAAATSTEEFVFLEKKWPLNNSWALHYVINDPAKLLSCAFSRDSYATIPVDTSFKICA